MTAEEQEHGKSACYLHDDIIEEKSHLRFPEISMFRLDIKVILLMVEDIFTSDKFYEKYDI